MTEDLKKYFRQLIKMVDGLHAIIITDRDGVPVIKVGTEAAPEMSLRPKFLGTSGMAMDQASKLGLGNNRTVVSMFSNYQVVSFNKLPIIVTMIAADSANTGMLLSLEDEMNPIINDIRSAVDVS